jgi:alkylation response protein AidB-like acyl-CoA dehydrogenase
VENLVGEEGKGWTYAKFLLENERVLVSEVGRSTRELRRLKALAMELRRDGRPLSADPLFARRVAELDLRLHVLQAMCYRTVVEVTKGAEPGAGASIMKMRGSELQQDIAEAMVDATGLAGVVFDPEAVTGQGSPTPVGHPAAQGMLRDHLYGRATTIFGGSNEIQRNIIAKAVLGL